MAKKNRILFLILFSIFLFTGIYLLLPDFKPKCPSDINQDGITNNQDYNTINDKFGQTCVDCREDINKDGKIDNLDLLAVLAKMNVKCN
ncbi:MAG: hypothetical protein HC906_17045 [Bacteroidales bacterium]|nr:hypothetical protein [Bacteroidales bacterium]